MLVLNQREKVIAFLTGVFLFSVVWTYFVLQPIYNYEMDLDAKLKAKSVKIYEAQKVMALSANNPPKENLLKPFFAEGSPQEEMSRLIKEIETTATGEGLQVIEIKPQPFSQKTDWIELKVNISFDGRLAEVVKFLYKLEQSSKPLWVNEMNLEASMPQQTTIRGRLEIGRLLVSKSAGL